MTDLPLVENKTFGCETVTSGVLSKFAKTHGLPSPIKVPIRTKGLTGSGDALKCHINALVLAYRYGGTVLTGFTGVGGEEDRCDHEYSVLCSHSVWVTPEGNAVCPTLHNDIYTNPKGFEFIPCLESDEFAVRDFFESGATPIIFEDVVHCLRDRSYVVAEGTSTAQVLAQLGAFARMSAKEWKQTVKTYEKRGIGGTRNYPLRKRLLTKPAFRRRFTLDFVLQRGGTDFMRKVLPNLKSSAALCC